MQSRLLSDVGTGWSVVVTLSFCSKWLAESMLQIAFHLSELLFQTTGSTQNRSGLRLLLVFADEEERWGEVYSLGKPCLASAHSAHFLLMLSGNMLSGNSNHTKSHLVCSVDVFGAVAFETAF